MTVDRSTTRRDLRRELKANGLHLTVEAAGDRVVLSGRVASAGDRQAAEDIVRRFMPGRRIDNDLEVEAEFPETPGEFASDAPSFSDPPDSVAEIRERGGEIEPDFTDQDGLADPGEAAGPSGGWEDPAESGDEVYVPPTDPVVTTDRHGVTQVLGGFSSDSMEELGVARSSDGTLGDEAIRDAVRRELREDASTTDLQHIRVEVRGGVVYLRGTVRLVEDAEHAEEVAGRVPGVAEIVEELEVTTL